MVSIMTKPGRLQKNREFKLVFEKGTSVATRGVVLYRLCNGLDCNRAGFITSKKIGNAVVRNRVRRLLKESFRLYSENLKPGNDLVFIARVPSAGFNFTQAAAEMKDLLQRGGLLTIITKRSSESK